VTVLTVGGRVASAHVGFASRGEVHLGLLAHNPFLAKHSPGKFHLLFLAQLLKEEGYQRLDLTAGDDPYKDHFANDCDEVHTLTFYLSPARRAKAAVRERVLGAVPAGPVKSLVRRLKGGHPLRLLRDARGWLGRRREVRVYSLDAARAREFDGPGPVRRDAVEDLLDYQAAEPWQSRQSFLATAWARIEDGLHVYTHARDGRLEHFAWLAERQEKLSLGEGQEEFPLPANSAYLFDCYTFPHARRRGLFGLSLRAMARDAALVPGTKRIFTSVLADQQPARRVVEKAGFAYEGSLFEEVRFGRARSWARVP
jgi:RimJ/RimL family protein N-acetyltransferase